MPPAFALGGGGGSTRSRRIHVIPTAAGDALPLSNSGQLRGGGPRVGGRGNPLSLASLREISAQLHVQSPVAFNSASSSGVLAGGGGGGGAGPVPAAPSTAADALPLRAALTTLQTSGLGSPTAGVGGAASTSGTASAAALTSSSAGSGGKPAADVGGSTGQADSALAAAAAAAAAQLQAMLPPGVQSSLSAQELATYPALLAALQLSLEQAASGAPNS
jgi:hypothetical protein